MKIKALFMIFLVGLFIHKYASSSDILTVRHIDERASDGNKQWGQYFMGLVKLALEETKETDGDFQMTPRLSADILQQRSFQELGQDNIDIFWSMTSIKRETNPSYRPIRIPLLKGFLGYRIFIIRENEQNKFDRIQDINSLKTLIAGQGRNWPDVDILRLNELPVITGASYEGLFNMLIRNRFDYFPRGVMEPWDEIKQRPDYKLAIEKKLALHYPTAIYFFVNTKNTKLYARVEKGLLKAINNGNFDKYLQSHPFGKMIYNNANISNRKVIPLKNRLTIQTQKVLLDKKFAYQF